MTTAEVVAWLRVSRATLWRRVASGRLPRPVDQGRQAIFSRSEVAAALDRDRRVSADKAVIIEQQIAALIARRRKRLDSV